MNHEHEHHVELWFSNSGFWSPHAHCVLYDPAIIFLDFWGNVMVGTAYLLIPALLCRLILGMWNHMAPAMKGLVIHGSIFVLLCGTTHFLHAYNWSNTAYVQQAFLEIITGIVSLWFVVSLFFFIRKRKWEFK